MIQLTGDEALYGRDYIVEPIADETPNPGYNGNYVRTTTCTDSSLAYCKIYLPSNLHCMAFQDGTGVTTLHTGIRGELIHGITITVTILTGMIITTAVTITTQSPLSNRMERLLLQKSRSYSPEVSHRISNGVYKTTYSRPEQRRGGEELFAKKHPEEYRKSTRSK